MIALNTHGTLLFLSSESMPIQPIDTAAVQHKSNFPVALIFEMFLQSNDNL